jgi:hypothetical protein
VFVPAYLDGTTEAPPANVEFVLVEPDPALFPPPWPTTVVQHGFQGQEIDVLTLARPFNDEGIATIGIDAVSHGQRGNVAGFLDPQDLRKVRENFRQTVLDQLQVCRLAVAAGIDVDGQPGADLAGECFYIGQSMGGVLGGVFAALSRDTEVAVLDVPGGGLTHILASPTLGPIVAILFQSALGLTGRDQAWADNLPFFSWIGQTTLDASDPINYGAVALAGHPSGRARKLLLQAGVGDTLIPNETTTALAQTIGLPELAGPVDDAAGVSGVWWVDLADYGIQSVPGGDLDPHNILNLLPGVERQGAIYMRSAGTSVVDPHTVNDPYE